MGDSKSMRFIISLVSCAGLIIAGCGLFAGCGPTPTPEKVVETVEVTKEVPVEVTKEVVVTATPAPTPEPRFDGVTLYISAIEEVYIKAFSYYADEIFDKWGIKMEFDTVSVTDAYKRDFLEFSMLSSSHDIVLVFNPYLADYARHLEPVEPLAEKWGLDLPPKEDVLDAFRTYERWGGVRVGVLFSPATRSLMYNKPCFEGQENKDAFKATYGYELAPPETWDQYKDMAEFFNGRDCDGDGEPEYGTTEAWRKGLWAYVWWLDRFGSYGGVYFDEDMNPLINSPAGVKALQNMLDVSPFVPPGTPSLTNPEVRGTFLRGDSAMITNWSSLEIAAMFPDATPLVGDLWPALTPGVMYEGKVVRHPAFGAAWVMGIPRYAKNKDAAIHVISYMAEKEHHIELCKCLECNINPSFVSDVEADEWYEVWPDYPQYADEFLSVLAESARIGIPDLVISGSSEYVAALDTEIGLALVGQKTPEQALNDAAKAWDEITDRFGRDQQKAQWTAQYDAMKELGIVYNPEIAAQ
jgi:multiple sugar transport system substrate-binding protein